MSLKQGNKFGIFTDFVNILK